MDANFAFLQVLLVLCMFMHPSLSSIRSSKGHLQSSKDTFKSTQAECEAGPGGRVTEEGMWPGERPKGSRFPVTALKVDLRIPKDQ